MSGTQADPRLIERTRLVAQGEGYVVVDKPAGVLSVPGKHEHNKRCVLDWVRARFPHASGPLVVHRLDMDTSGLLVIALTAAVQRVLSGQFERQEVRKAYVALVEGRVPAESGEVRVPMRPDYANRPYQVVDFLGGREAVTRWRLLALDADRSRLRLEPSTGRTHQLRVHCAWRGSGAISPAGHPIVGDVLYGRAEPGVRLHLHASELAFADPADGRWIQCASPPEF